MTDLKTYIITLKDSVSQADVDAFKKKVNDLGGSIASEFSLFKGFVAKLPANTASVFDSHENVKSVEEDQEVHIQK